MNLLVCDAAAVLVAQMSVFSWVGSGQSQFATGDCALLGATIALFEFEFEVL